MTDIDRKVKTPLLADIPPDFDPRLITILRALQESVDLREGRTAKGTNSRFVTIQDLIDAGVINEGDIT